MKRSGFLPRYTPLARKTKLRVVGDSDTARVKEEIQDTVRDIVILRDDGCIFRVLPWHECSGYARDGHLILQADHLLPRNNSATYADTRLIVCVCQGIHAWKSLGNNANKAEYDEIVRTLISPERVKLWDACEQERRSQRGNRAAAFNWNVTLAAVRQELRQMQSI